MTLRAKFKDRKRSALGSAAAGILIGLILLVDPIIGKGLQRWSYDLLFALRPTPAAEKVNPTVVIYMDRTSHEVFGQPDNQAWHRLLHAELIRDLDERGAKAIVFDVLMDEPWTNKTIQPVAQEILINRFGYASNQVVGAAVDELFRRTLETTRCPVILAAEQVRQRDEQNRFLELMKVPTEDILPEAMLQASPWGLVNFPAEADDAIRRHNFSKSPLGLAAKVSATLGRPVAEPELLRWINYYGPLNTLTNISYHKALDPEGTTSQFFSNKVVYVGRGTFTTSQGSRTTDEWATPYNRWHDKDTTGVEIQATAFLNLWNRDWLRQLPYWLEAFMALFTGLSFGIGLALARPWVAARWAIFGIAAAVAGSFFLAWNTYWWFAWMIPALVQIPLALTWSVIANSRVLYREKAVLERTLATLRTEQGPHPQQAHQPPASSPDESHPTVITQGGNLPSRSDPPSRPGDPAAPPIPDHTMLRCVGRGAYGEVWLAKDIIGTFHAVKVVYKRNFASENPYHREFNGLKKFTPISRSHPGLVNILHVGRHESDDYFYSVMEVGDDEKTGTEIHPENYSPRNLARDLAKRGNLPVTECLNLGLALSDALEFLHQKRLIHRDIKPSNIIFVQDQPKFADIGLVTEIAEKGRNVSMLGTEGFIAPEGPGSPAADVYSLGKLLYETCMGRDRQKFPELPTDLTRRPDEEALLRLNGIILRACETDLSERYTTARELHADLKILQENL